LRNHVLASLLAACFCLATPLGAQNEGKFIQAELQTPIKAKRAKPGERVKAKTVGSVTLPNGVKVSAGETVFGEVTAAEANSVSIVFDQIEIDGKKTPMKLFVRAAMMPGGDPAKQGEAVPVGAVIGMDGVTLQTDDGPRHATKFQSSGKELQLKTGLQLMLGAE